MCIGKRKGQLVGETNTIIIRGVDPRLTDLLTYVNVVDISLALAHTYHNAHVNISI